MKIQWDDKWPMNKCHSYPCDICKQLKTLQLKMWSLAVSQETTICWSLIYQLIQYSMFPNTNLQIANFEGCKHEFHPRQAWVKLQLALCFLLLVILQVYHFPSPFPPPVSNSSCLFTQCQLLYAISVLYYYTLQGTVRLKVFCFLMYCLCDKY